MDNFREYLLMSKLLKRAVATLVLFGLMINNCKAGNPYSIESAIYRIEIVDGQKLHTGTGVLIAQDTILTNCHVVRHRGVFKVVNRKTGNAYPTQSYTNLGSLDACLLKGTQFEGSPVRMNTQYKIGESIWAYGYPNRYAAMSQGVMVGLINTDVGQVFQTSTFCHPGSSGGPLVNNLGELIGLVFGTKTDYKDHCLAIPIADVISKLRD